MKIATIWARVSTSGQTSLPDQIARAKEKLQEKGYTVPADRILAVDWTSLDLFSCPQFQTLISWVKRREIQGLGILDRDRLQAEGVQRLTFLTECRDAGVELVICQGPALIEGDEGQLIELALTIGKKRSILRAKQGAKNGMKDKVARDRKPTSRHKVTGYKWDGDLRLLPTEDWEKVKVALDMSLRGATGFDIEKAFKKRGILTSHDTIYNWLRNPIYGGRYYALSREVVQPKKCRSSDTYGATSARTIPLEQRVYLPEVQIVNPPLTWEEWLQIQERRRRNQELAQRNAKRDYLLRGLIFCETHRGKKGESRRYYGQPQNRTYGYTCPVGRCAHPNLNGPQIEADAKDFTWMLLNLEPDEFYRRVANRQSRHELESSLRSELEGLDVKLNRNINAETELESRNLLGQEHPEVYRRLRAKFQAERIWIEEREKAINGQLAQLDREAEAVATLQQIRADFKDRLGQLTNAEWRELFIALNLEIHVRDKDNPETWTDRWSQDTQFNIAPANRRDIEITFGLPLKAEPIRDIVFTRASLD